MHASELGWMLLPFAGTAVGGLAILALRRPGPIALDAALGFTGGVMVAASVFSLLVPALERGALWEVLVGFGAGAAAIGVLDRWVPHVHERFRERGHRPDPTSGDAQRARLLLSALTIHNIPEGAAVGVAFAAGGAELGVPITVAITVQNVPEGFAAAAPLLGGRLSILAVAGVAAATGIVEPPAALLAYAAVSVAAPILAGALAFAAAAMLYVVVDELVPEMTARGNERIATAAFMAGFAVMMVLDVSLG